MAKKTYKGRAILPGELTGKALVSRQPFNTTVSIPFTGDVSPK